MLPTKQLVAFIQQTQNICITFVQRRPNVFDVGPTFYKCYTNVLCSLDSQTNLFISYHYYVTQI